MPVKLSSSEIGRKSVRNASVRVCFRVFTPFVCYTQRDASLLLLLENQNHQHRQTQINEAKGSKEIFPLQKLQTVSFFSPHLIIIMMISFAAPPPCALRLLTLSKIVLFPSRLYTHTILPLHAPVVCLPVNLNRNRRAQ